jgi:hypothetical protein
MTGDCERHNFDNPTRQLFPFWFLFLLPCYSEGDSPVAPSWWSYAKLVDCWPSSGGPYIYTDLTRHKSRSGRENFLSGAEGVALLLFPGFVLTPPEPPSPIKTHKDLLSHGVMRFSDNWNQIQSRRLVKIPGSLFATHKKKKKLGRYDVNWAEPPPQTNKKSSHTAAAAGAAGTTTSHYTQKKEGERREHSRDYFLGGGGGPGDMSQLRVPWSDTRLL